MLNNPALNGIMLISIFQKASRKINQSSGRFTFLGGMETSFFSLCGYAAQMNGSAICNSCDCCDFRNCNISKKDI